MDATQTKTKVTIIINKHPFHFATDELEPADFRKAVDAPAEYEVWRVVKDSDPEGQLPIDDIQVTARTPIKSGEHYRVVPPGTFGRR